MPNPALIMLGNTKTVLACFRKALPPEISLRKRLSVAVVLILISVAEAALTKLL
jgi:hypothetical protein